MIQSDCVSVSLSFFLIVVYVCFSVCLFVSFKWWKFVYRAFQKAQRTGGAKDTAFMTRGCFCVSVWMNFFNCCLTVCICIHQPINDGQLGENLQIKNKNFMLNHKVVFIIFKNLNVVEVVVFFVLKKKTICRLLFFYNHRTLATLYIKL